MEENLWERKMMHKTFFSFLKMTLQCKKIVF